MKERPIITPGDREMLFDLIKGNQLQEACDILHKVFAGRDSNIQKDIILLQSRVNRCEKAQIRGISNQEEFNREWNGISHALLNLVLTLKTSTESSFKVLHAEEGVAQKKVQAYHVNEKPVLVVYSNSATRLMVRLSVMAFLFLSMGIFIFLGYFVYENNRHTQNMQRLSNQIHSLEEQSNVLNQRTRDSKELPAEVLNDLPDSQIN